MENYTNNDMFKPLCEKPCNYIKVVGVGGGGGNAVNHMLEEGIQGVDFVLCNTDYQALTRSAVPLKIHLGKRELGAGNDPSVGREAALSSEDEINKVLDDHTKMLFVTAGMGGGTGTGAAPVVARIAKEKGILTVGIVTLPFECEGRRRKQQAQAGIEELKKNVDTLIIISSDKLRDSYGNMKLTEAFKKADDVLTTAAKGIAEIITVTGYVNVDFEDVKTVMKESGRAIMGTGRAKGENRAEEAIKMAINSPLLNDSNIEGAKNVLLYITSGTDEVSLDEVVEITEYTQSICGNCSDVIWGNGVDESLGDEISVTLIATGFESGRRQEARPQKVEENKPKVEPFVVGNVQGSKKHDLYETTETKEPVQETAPKEEQPQAMEQPQVVEQPQAVEQPQVVEQPQAVEQPAVESKPKVVVHSLDEEEHVQFEEPVFKSEAPAVHETTAAAPQPEPAPGVKVFDNPFLTNNDDDDSFEISNHSMAASSTLQEVHEVETIVMEEPKAKPYDPKEELKRNRLRALSLNFKTQKGLEELERQPAYMRRNKNYEEIETEDEVSRYSTTSKGISSENSFLHDNVD
ncbi:MAG: cell division protein FtsZ [Bacteroidales bacterium]|nr:cell division protein FtsZ [Bacteroidales bacterium]